ncbi:MAG: SH3 domain-containing protein [Scytonematopsis contorta HA4267-MV1]|jgi:outer membrane biosynthesis protein TonB|nr:SH3 domain-containing protein [Scytonematopsis contorta HA4267-MV1]
MQQNNNSVNIWELVQKFISENTTVTITVPFLVVAALAYGYKASSNSTPQPREAPVVAPSSPPSVVNGRDVNINTAGPGGVINNNVTNTNTNTNNVNHNHPLLPPTSPMQSPVPPSSGYPNTSTKQTKPQEPKQQIQSKATQPQPKAVAAEQKEQPQPKPQVTQPADDEVVAVRPPQAPTQTCNISVVYDPKDTYVNLRSSPNGQVLQKIPNGNKVNIDSSRKDGDWSFVNLGGSISGYVKNNLLRNSSTHHIFDRNDTFANLRSAPNGTVLHKVNNGTPVTILPNTESNDWVQVRLNTGNQAIGYMSLSRIANPSCNGDGTFAA